MKLKQIQSIAIFLAFSGGLVAAPDSTELFYKEHPGQMVWIVDGKWNTCAQALMDQLNHVDEEGLDPQDYAPKLAELKAISLSDSTQQMKADEILTSLTLNYISDMKGERLNPRKVDKDLYIKPVEVSEVQLLQGYLANPGSCAWIANLAPMHKDYQDLKDLLAQYRKIQEAGGWPQLSKGKDKLERGAQGDAVQILRQQLVAQGSLDAAHQSGTVFDEGLDAALKSYQETHGLEPDGKVGPATLEALNTPVEKRIAQIIVSLERERWLPQDLGPRYVLVNIAGFELDAVNDRKLAFTMPVITGQAYRQTPSFYSQISEIILNPSWHVPYNIAVKDKLPKLQKNPNAFSGKGYNFYDSAGNSVSPSAVNWGAYSAGNFPYKIVQNPGSANALGRIRFTVDYESLKLPNLSVYLHGTPDQGLFSKSQRSFSSGCIRVEDPVKLATFIFDDPASWSPEKIRAETSNTKTDRVKLKNPIPVYITYYTVWKDPQGRPHFVKDIYGQDKQVWDALQRRRKNQ